MLGFARREDMDNWVRNVRVLAYSLQNIAPAEAGDGPNPEYPWPHAAPADFLAGHAFELWTRLANTGQGRKLIQFVGHAIERFDSYG